MPLGGILSNVVNEYMYYNTMTWIRTQWCRNEPETELQECRFCSPDSNYGTTGMPTVGYRQFWIYILT